MLSAVSDGVRAGALCATCMVHVLACSGMDCKKTADRIVSHRCFICHVDRVRDGCDLQQ